MSNPLLNHQNLPAFSTVKPEHVVNAVETIIKENEQTLAEVLAQEGTPTCETLVAPLDEKSDKLDKAWAVVSHLNSVANSDELREAYEAGEQLLTQYYAKIGQNKALYQAYEALAQEPYFSSLSQAQKQTVENALRNFRLAGVALGAEQQARFTEIQSELSSLTTQFANNVMDATQGWYKQVTDEAHLAGIPAMAKEAAANAAKKKDVQGWVFTLDIPSYLAVITHADNRALREEMYRAFATRASSESPVADEQKVKWDNTPLIEKILALRLEKAQLLGFNNYAEVSIAPKMAESTEQVIGFLEDLAAKAKPQAAKEKATLEQFAKTELGLDELNAWDVAYASEKLKEKTFNVSQEALREYFPLQKVQAGMFTLVEKLFDVRIQENTESDTYHPDVSYFDIYRNDTLIASFYWDLFAREKKRGGAWMADGRIRRKTAEGLQKPVAFLTCNFNGPVGDKPALLTHDEVTTLFHEFGHGLHHMLTQIDIPAVSGINGVAWDAVELPSQFMENFCWEKEVLPLISGHYATNEPLPEDMLNNMIAGNNFQSAMQMVRQLEFSLFDFVLHKDFGTEQFSEVQSVLDTIRDKVSVIVPPSFNKFQNSFTHIFAGGYAAGYYSYKWAEVLSADAFAAFEEEGVLNEATGKRFLHSILEQGGSQQAMVLFENFRGRKPSVDPLLRHSGIVEVAA